MAFLSTKVISSKKVLEWSLGMILGTSSMGWSLHAKANDTDARIRELKQSILEIASENQNRLDNFKEVRGKLDPLVEEIAGLKELSVEDSLQKKIGPWQQVWTDDLDDVRPNNLFVKVDRAQTYQVVLGNGRFYNVSVVNLPLGIQFSVYLAGDYEVDEKILNLEFSSLRLRLGGLALEQLSRNVEKAETNTLLGLVPFPGGGRAPNGPVGVKGEIKTVYIDDEVRIDYGKNLNDGVEDLFILKKLAQ